MADEACIGGLPTGDVKFWAAKNVAIVPLETIADMRSLVSAPFTREHLCGVQITSYEESGKQTHLVTWGGDYGIVITDNRLDDFFL